MGGSNPPHADMNIPQDETQRLRLLIQLQDISDLNRARVAMTRLRVNTERLNISQEAKNSRTAIIEIAEKLIDAEINQLLHATDRAANLRS